MAQITRRQVLVAAAAVGVASVSAGTGIYLRFWDRAPMDGLEALSVEEHEFVQALAEAWLPPGGEPSLSGAQAQLGTYLDGCLMGLEPAQRRLFKALLQGMDQLPRVSHFSRYQDLDLQSRTEILDGWLNESGSLVRSGAASIVVLLGFGWTTHPEVVPYVQRSFSCVYGR